MSGHKLIWTAMAIDRWERGNYDPRHAISAPNIADVYDGFVSQMRAGTPWILIDPTGRVIDAGTAGGAPVPQSLRA